MARIASKPTWGVPLVLPHVLVSIGLLIFATMSERTAQPVSETSATVLRDAGPLHVSVSATTSKATRGI